MVINLIWMTPLLALGAVQKYSLILAVSLPRYAFIFLSSLFLLKGFFMKFQVTAR